MYLQISYILDSNQENTESGWTLLCKNLFIRTGSRLEASLSLKTNLISYTLLTLSKLILFNPSNP